MEIVGVILTSIAVSSLVSGIFLIINDFLRRKSEEKRAMLEIAIKLTELRNDQILEVLNRTNKKVLWSAPISTFEKTFKFVKDIWEGKYQKGGKPPFET